MLIIYKLSGYFNKKSRLLHVFATCAPNLRVYKQKVSAQNSILIFYIQYNLLSFADSHLLSFADTHLLSAHFTNRGKGCVFYTMYLLFIKELCLKKKSRPDCSKSSQSVYYPAVAVSPVQRNLCATLCYKIEFKIKKAGSFLLSRECSIIGAKVLDFRVRYGNGYCHLAMATGILCSVIICFFKA